MPDKLKINTKVCFYGRTIHAEACNGTFTMGVTDFSRTQVIAARPRTVLEFEAGISRDEAMAVLKALLDEIEANGLPDLCWPMEQMQAKVFSKIVKDFNRLERHCGRLSPRDQQKFREFMELNRRAEESNVPQEAPFPEPKK